ncbi:hypothetical protein [Ornithinimicrobium faecis]|uniref:Lipoprotein n=1 Tax=Ornithinimicrobium faecis TaxID=2934158 RepID=A0ABY4YVY4_9MICO|nr:MULTISPECIES: hypothetical protein [unclassified Ornithinimicrobium]USQ80936.1 hypothetical protein NF556_04610 [Ornithinimicrobium sp. HY1793]
MTIHAPRLAVFAVATGLALGGCSAADPAADQPEAVVAVEWAEHLCHGRYTDAHALMAEQARINPRTSPDNPRLMAADHLAADDLDRLNSAGTETSTEIEVEEVTAGTGSDPSSVALSGSCWGEPFSHTVEVAESDDGWQVSTELPLWSTPTLFDYPGHNAFAQLTFERGVAFSGSGQGSDRWLLLPGRHNVTVPPHFLTGDAVQSEITVDAFRIVEQGSLPAVSTDQIDAAFTDFATTCGDLCLVTPGEAAGSDAPGEEPVPLTPMTIEPVTGAEAHLTADAVLIRPTGAAPGFYDTRPESWGQEDSPDTGVALLENVALERTYLSCPADAAPCTVTVAEKLDGLEPVFALLFVDAGEEVAVSGLT